MLRILSLSFFFLFIALQDKGWASDNRVSLISSELPSVLLYETKEGVGGHYATYFREAAKRSGVEIDIQITPWLRAVHMTQRADNLLIFPFTRTEARENNFIWHGQLRNSPICFIAINREVNNLEDARNLDFVVIHRGTSHHKFLKSQGFTNLVETDSADTVEKLFKFKENVAWFKGCVIDEPLFDSTDLNDKLRLGTPVNFESVWLASGLNFKKTPSLDKFLAAIEDLRNERFLENLSKMRSAEN